jgi:alanyl-tRNA synthetase
MNSDKIRQQFLDFFKERQHEIVDSSPVVPHDDPTLMFTNAGMNQFKDVFLGLGSRPYSRAADTQKCIRAGGKHNDLDDVGQDTYHQTYFEMLGNWSFGDYFKKEAIQWAWELLTDVWGIEKDRLHVTYFEGDSAEGLEPDDEAARLWAEVTDIDPTHIHPGNKKDNFWEMGDTGPCGPCSEIHVDLTHDKSGQNLVNAGDANVIELWNLVFIQFNRAGDGSLSPLPAKHVDTGMGFERLCAILNGKKSNYDTDVFEPLFEEIRKRCNAPEYSGTLPGNEPNQNDVTKEQLMADVTYRVIADHVRCLVFAITDGGCPSNEGAGYVLRRILRRSVRYGRQYFNMHEPFLCDLVQPLTEQMGDYFGELRTGPDPSNPRDNVEYVTEIIREEEKSFFATLERGLREFDAAACDACGHAIAKESGWKYEGAGTQHAGPGSAESIKPHWTLGFLDENSERREITIEEASCAAISEFTKARPKISGDSAFLLHDTFGFSIDLTKLMAEERGLTVDVDNFERLMEEARERARGATGAVRGAALEAIARCGRTQFSGYAEAIKETSVLDVFQFDDKVLVKTNNLEEGQRGIVVLEETPFYAEQGGQVGDGGIIEAPDKSWCFHVTDTKKVLRTYAHFGRCERGRILPRNVSAVSFDKNASAPELEGDYSLGVARAQVDMTRRLPTMQNHTATHILNWALREVLGSHVQQKGSLVDPDKTRFDLSHPKPIADDEMKRIEHLVNEKIAAGLTVYTKEVEQAQAREINTLRAVFGEKYPNIVRVVSIGADIDEMLKEPKNPEWMKYSVEFCGGTHLKKSSEAVAFVLIAEEAVAKGVRRVVGLSGDAAEKARKSGEELLAKANQLATGPDDQDLAQRVTELQNQLTDAVIPVATRHEIRTVIADLQRVLKERGKENAASAAEGVMARVKDLFESAETIGQTCVVAAEVPAANADALRGAIDWLRQKSESSAVLLACHEEGKVTLVAGVSRDLVKLGVKAGDMIKEVAPIVGGRGGGRPDLAQGGGSDPAKIPDAVEAARDWLRAKLG